MSNKKMYDSLSISLILLSYCIHLVYICVCLQNVKLFHLALVSYMHDHFVQHLQYKLIQNHSGNGNKKKHRERKSTTNRINIMKIKCFYMKKTTNVIFNFKSRICNK